MNEEASGGRSCETDGHSLMARDFDREVAETQVRIGVLNRYTALGIPDTEPIGKVCPGKGEDRPSNTLSNKADRFPTSLRDKLDTFLADFSDRSYHL